MFPAGVVDDVLLLSFSLVPWSSWLLLLLLLSARAVVVPNSASLVPSSCESRTSAVSSGSRVDCVVRGRDAAELTSTALLSLLALSLLALLLSLVEALVPLSGAGAEELTCCCCGVAVEAVGAVRAV